MKTPPTHDRQPDEDDRPIYGTHPGDLGVVVIAAIISLGFFYLLLGPSPFGSSHPQTGAAPAAAAKVQPVPKAETQMMLYDTKKP